MTARHAELTLRLRGRDGTLTTRTVSVEARQNTSRLAALQWARLSLASLEGEARIHRQAIREIGRRFGLATPETSLIVLERVDDYVRNDIEPPPALREAYDRLASTLQKDRARSDAARLAEVVRRFEARVAWWNRDFPKDDAAQAGARDRQERKPRCRRVARCTARAPDRGCADQRRAAARRRAAPPAAPAPMLGRRQLRGPGEPERRPAKKDAGAIGEHDQHLDRPEAGIGECRVDETPGRGRPCGAPGHLSRRAAAPTR